jgi:DcuC family C4-dicarboxylate transporter
MSRGKPKPLIAFCLSVLAALSLLGAWTARSGDRPSLENASKPATQIAVAAAPARATSVSIAIVVLLLVVVLATQGTDVRIVLMLSAIPLYLSSGRLSEMISRIAAEMANAGTVIPIGAAIGFAFVLRVTGCDQHLVQLMLAPIRRARLLLIPGGIAAGYLLNTTIVSQSGTAAVLGPILIPLLRTGGLGPASAGAVLLLGSSMGGELFNPGAVEMRKLSELTGLTGNQVVARSTPLNLLSCTIAAGCFWIFLARKPSGLISAQPDPVADPTTAPLIIRPWSALVPVVPILLLALDPLLGRFSPLGTLTGPSRILTAMLIGVVAAGIANRAQAGNLASAFFDGAGYGYTHVISLIVAASTFAEGIRLSGLIEILIQTIAPWPVLAMAVAVFAPCALAAISGTGIAPAIAIMEFFVPEASRMGIDPVRLGTLSALGAHFGRTMSPASAVVMVSAKLADAPASELIRQVAGPLLIGATALLVATLSGLL